MSAPMSALTISETRNLVLPLDTVLEALVHFDRKGNGAAAIIPTSKTEAFV